MTERSFMGGDLAFFSSGLLAAAEFGERSEQIACAREEGDGDQKTARDDSSGAEEFDEEGSHGVNWLEGKGSGGLAADAAAESEEEGSSEERAEEEAWFGGSERFHVVHADLEGEESVVVVLITAPREVFETDEEKGRAVGGEANRVHDAVGVVGICGGPGLSSAVGAVGDQKEVEFCSGRELTHFHEVTGKERFVAGAGS